MQTRGAARKAAEASLLPKQDNNVATTPPLPPSASATGEDPATTANVPEFSTGAPSPTLPMLKEAPILDGSATGEELASSEQSRATSKAPSTGPKGKATVPKKKRGKAAPRQPMKGGWVPPHGMGVAINPTAAPSSNHDEGESSTEPAQDETPAAENAITPTIRQRPPAKSKGKQTKLGFRLTKRSDPTKEEGLLPNPVVLEPLEPEPLKKSQHVESQLETNSKRLTRSAASRQIPKDEAQDASTAVKKEEPAETEVPAVTKSTVVVKGENPTVIADVAAGISPRKLLIIKGVVITDGTSRKSGQKVIVDATQILDPNFRMMLKRGLDNKYGLTPGFSPYPYRRVPTPDDCEEVYRLLAEMHGECMPPKTMPAASLTVAGCGEVPCVLDALLRTLISGYTKMEHADQAIKNLVENYGLRNTGTGKGSIDWEKVRQSPHGELKKVIEIAGGGNQRAKFIKSTLNMVYEENLAKLSPERDADADLLSLDHMHKMTKDEALAKFVSYPGIGIKTAACVTLFCLQIPCFAVDTHVHRFCRWLGWTPPKADPDNCFRHTDHMVPDHLKYGLHQLFIRHGQLCFKCRAITKPGTKDWNEAPDCPLEHLLTRTKDEAVSGKRKRATDEDGSDGDDEEGQGVDEIKPKTKKPRTRKVEAAKEAINEDDSDVEMEDGDDKDEDEKNEVPPEVKTKTPRTRKAKATKPPVRDDSDTEMEVAKPASRSLAKAKTKSNRATRARAAEPPVDEFSKTDEEATKDEAELPKMEVDDSSPVPEAVVATQADAESDSELSELESQQFGMEVDTGSSQNEAANTSQDTTVASSVLSELSEISDLTDVSDVEDK